ncbi:prephenate dehydratase [Tepidibacter aestuarii]|uniref:prephenate dehydratase n=1 Tax=Tepidibacter aestuarii TaxID=2925782 RepID=UPI0020BF17C5|nr:prephenate dehydratase [Tepidibacter aestuarii]CAH2213837.1 chorismate mutase / prephenate dehydratase [Tepidibacter aestuarii]
MDNLRKEIDCIDKELIKLFEKRMEKVLEIAEYKYENNFPILNIYREEQVLSKNTNYIKNKYFQKSAQEFLKNIMDISRSIQEDQLSNYIDISDKKKHKTKNTIYKNKENEYIVGFQGVHGSFSEQALIEYFGEEAKTKNLNEFEDVFKALKNDKIDYGVLPIENSSTGGISEIYDLLRKYGLYIIGEKCLKVDHNLLVIKGTKIEDIKEVYSHSQAFQQSSEFFKGYPDWKLIPYSNTAISAKFIKNENSKTKAAVSSKKAAQLYDLDILESNINFNQSNYTRFIVIGKNLEISNDCNKISILFSISHKPGTLFNILKYFAQNNLNMTKIESRPIIDKSWEYFFYIDFEGCLRDEVVKETIKLIEKESIYFKLLGNYKSHKI